MKNIISASRRTDIPRFFARWFGKRRKAGYAQFRNAFGGRGSVSLRTEDVLGYLFWTRYAKPFREELHVLREEGLPYVVQYTINAYGRELDPHVPRLADAISDFVFVSVGLPSPNCIQWRYDPIIVSDRYGVNFHLQSFHLIAAALEGATKVVNTSFVEPYLKAIRRVGDVTVRYRTLDPMRHRTVATRYPNLGQIKGEGITLLECLAAAAQEYGMELRVCSNPEWQFPRAQCCGVELFQPYGSSVTQHVKRLKQGPSRAGCRCLKVVDIGMDNTCLAGCRYCYAVQSHQSVMKNSKRHDPAGPMLR